MRQLPGADGDDDQNAAQLENIDHRREEGPQPDEGELRGNVAARLAVEPGQLLILAVVRLHQGRVGEALLGHGGDRAFPPPLRSGDRLDAAGKVATSQPEGRGDDQRDKRQPPVDEEEGPGEEDDLQDVAEDGGYFLGQELADLVDVVRQPGQHVAEALPVEECHRQRVHVAKHPVPYIEQKPFADPGREVVPSEREYAAADRQPEVGKGDRQQQAEVARHQNIIDEPTVEGDGEGLEQRSQRHQKQGERHPPPVRAGIGPEPADRLAQRDEGSGSDRSPPPRGWG